MLRQVEKHSFYKTRSGSLAIFAAVRRASSRVSNFAVDLRPAERLAVDPNQWPKMKVCKFGAPARVAYTPVSALALTTDNMWSMARGHYSLLLFNSSMQLGDIRGDPMRLIAHQRW